jgi:membrane-associated phospholipid phosphatase
MRPWVTSRRFPQMPILALFVIAVASGCVVFLLGTLYPTPIVGEVPAQAVGEKLGREASHHRWLARILRGRLDPATATGLALTVALAGAVAGGVVLGMLAYLMRTNAELLRVDRSVGQWGVDHRTPLSTDALRLVTDLGGTYVVVAVMVVVASVEYLRARNRWVPVFLVAVVVGETILVAIVKQALDRARPTFNPAAATLGPSFPSGHSATAAALYAAVALVISRRLARRPRAFIAGCAAAVAVAVACSRVLLGVHWLSDVLAGLAFGWAWFSICAIAFGGRFLKFGAPVERAKSIAGSDQSMTKGESRRGRDSAPIHY